MAIDSELGSLLQGCKDAPDDDAPRLVLADWLEEHGESDRAEFVRLSVRLAAQEVAVGDEAPSLARLHELSARHATRWLGALPDLGERLAFRRGLLELRCVVGALPRFADFSPAHALPWLETLVPHVYYQEHVGEVLQADVLRHFTALDVSDVR